MTLKQAKMNNLVTFPDVCLLITHYNRSSSLENLLSSFQNLNCVFGEIVVSDDGSNELHLNNLKALSTTYGTKLITTAKNRGLGNNINKGQDAVTKKYTLYIQEDFEPSPQFPEKLMKAINFMNIDSQLDYIRFYAYIPYPYTTSFDEDFDQMLVKPFGLNYLKIYLYSDHPHLRRTDFFKKFGRYPEGLKGDVTEYKMCISFIQNKAKGLFYKKYQQLLFQKNSEEEPSTMTRASWKQKHNLIIRLVRTTYRQLKYNLDILMLPPLNKDK